METGQPDPFVNSRFKTQLTTMRRQKRSWRWRIKNIKLCRKCAIEETALRRKMATNCDPLFVNPHRAQTKHDFAISQIEMQYSEFGSEMLALKEKTLDEIDSWLERSDKRLTKHFVYLIDESKDWRHRAYDEDPMYTAIKDKYCDFQLLVTRMKAAREALNKMYTHFV